VHVLLICAGAFVVLTVALLAVNLAAIPRLSRQAPAPPGETLPSLSIVIPARNEERDIAAAVRSHLAQDYEDLEVVVVEDRSTDATARILEELAAGNPRLRIIPGEEPRPGWLGKPGALARGAAAARGEMLLFADADVRYDPRCASEAVLHLTRHRIDLLALVPRMEARGFWENVLMPNLLFLFYCGPAFLANRDRTRWLAVGGGAGNLVRRTAYEAIGGHAALKDSVIDDVKLALLLKRAGYRTQVVRAEDRIAVRMYRGFREVWNGFSKNAAYLFSGGMGILLFAFLAATLLLSVLPVAVLVGAAAGASVPSADLLLAALGLGLLVATRMALALAIGEPLWPAWTHPILAVVWTGIIGRSLYLRVIRRRLIWRGREFDARGARF
jgi:chlorobactene glucosyltransferase